MLLYASSTDRDSAAKEITDTCRYFFNQDTAGLADQQLLVLFRELCFPDFFFAHEVVQASLSGNILYHKPGYPNNFSIFFFYEKLGDNLDNKKRLLMHMKSKDGKSKSNEEINESLLQVVVFP